MQSEIHSATPQPHHRRRVLFNYHPHPYQPLNVNMVFEAEKAAASFNKRVAIT